MTDQLPEALRHHQRVQNPLSRAGRSFREECSQRGHEKYAPVRDWMEDHGGPPQLAGNSGERKLAIDYAAANAYHLLARMFWSQAEADRFEENWRIAVNDDAFRRQMKNYLPKVESFLAERHRSREAGIVRE